VQARIGPELKKTGVVAVEKLGITVKEMSGKMEEFARAVTDKERSVTSVLEEFTDFMSRLVPPDRTTQKKLAELERDL